MVSKVIFYLTIVAFCQSRSQYDEDMNPVKWQTLIQLNISHQSSENVQKK